MVTGEEFFLDTEKDNCFFQTKFAAKALVNVSSRPNSKLKVLYSTACYVFTFKTEMGLLATDLQTVQMMSQ